MGVFDDDGRLGAATAPAPVLTISILSATILTAALILTRLLLLPVP